MEQDLEDRLALVEQHLAHDAVVLEDLSAVLNIYRQDLERLKAQVTRLEQRLALVAAEMGGGEAGSEETTPI